MGDQCRRPGDTAVVADPVVEAAACVPPSVDEGLGNQGFASLNQGLMGERAAPSLIDSLLAVDAGPGVGDAAGLGDPGQAFSVNLQDTFDPAGRAAGWAEARDQDWARRYGLERLGNMPMSVALGEDGITGGQLTFSNGWAVGASNNGVTVGYGESGATVSANTTHEFGVETNDAGAAVASDLRLGTHLGANGTLALAQYRLGGGYTYDASTEVHAGALDDGTVLDPTALAARAALLETRELDAEDGATQAQTLIEGLRDWQAGDRVRIATGTEGSLDVGIAGPAGFSVGGGGGGISERVVESMGDGVVQVTMSNTDLQTMRLAASGGFGAASLGLTGRDANLEVQQVTFDLNQETGRRDFLLNQYAGLLPGGADALGITTEAEALAFIEAGGMAASGLDMSAAELNASLADRAAEDSDFATANHYTDLRSELQSESGLDLSVLGISLFNSSHGSRFGERTTYEDGERTRSYTGGATYSQGSWLAENGQAGSSAEVTSGGAFDFSFTSSFDGRTDDATGPLADLRARSEAAEDLVDDPVLRQSVSGDTDALLAAAAAADLDQASLARYLSGWWDQNGMFAAESNPAAMAALQNMADERGVNVMELIGTNMDEIRQLGDPDFDASTLSPDAAAVYAMMAMGSPGRGDRFNALGVIAQQNDPDVQAELLAVMIASGGADATAEFLEWSQEHPEIAATLHVDSELIAGSTDAMSIVTRGEGGKDVDASDFTEDLVALAANPQDLQLVLEGLDRTIGVNEDGIGGVDRLLANLPAADLAAVLALGADSELIQQATVRLAATRPDLLIPPELSLEDRAAYVSEHLLPALETAGLENAAEIDPASLVAHARGIELRRDTADEAAQLADTPEGVAQQMIDLLGPSGENALWSKPEAIDTLIAAGIEGGPEAVEAILDAFGTEDSWQAIIDSYQSNGLSFDNGFAYDPIAYLVDQVQLLPDGVGDEAAVRLLEAVQGTRYEQRVEELIAEQAMTGRVEADAAMFARDDLSP
ncbi:MAG: hypothetical protein KC621_06430 [Myxococcales bacterium]|nr:hypothetical protein [Myxococcales bacterium]